MDSTDLRLLRDLPIKTVYVDQIANPGVIGSIKDAINVAVANETNGAVIRKTIKSIYTNGLLNKLVSIGLSQIRRTARWDGAFIKITLEKERMRMGSFEEEYRNSRL